LDGSDEPENRARQSCWGQMADNTKNPPVELELNNLSRIKIKKMEI